MANEDIMFINLKPFHLIIFVVFSMNTIDNLRKVEAEQTKVIQSKYKCLRYVNSWV